MKVLRLLQVGLVLFVSAAVLAACTFLDKNTHGGLQVITNDIPSSVFLNDTYLEKTPLIERNLQPGTYTLKIQPDDPSYVPYETSVTLREGVLTVVSWKPASKPELSGGVIYELEPLHSKATEVSFISIPDGAIVQVAGRDKEFAPYVFTDVQPGHTEFEATLPSYETQKHTIDVIAGYRMHITVKLAKLRSANEELTDEGLPETTPSATGSAAVATSSATIAPAAPSSASGKVTITATNFFQNGKEVLRVRSQPGSGAELGFAAVGSQLPYFGETQAGWYKVWFEGQTAWVASQYAQVVE